MADEKKLGNIKKELGKEDDEIKKLESEKLDLLEKNKNLASIIEEVTKGVRESPEGGKNDSGGLSGLKRAAQNLEEGLKSSQAASQQTPQQTSTNPQPAQATAHDSPSKNESNMKKELSEIIKKRVDSKFSAVSEELGKLGKLSDMEKKLTELTDRLNQQAIQPLPQGGGGGGTGRQLASFGEEVDFQSQIFDLKKAISEIARNVDTTSKKLDYRVSNLEDKSKTLERFPDLEERYEQLNQKLGPDNVQKLRKLIFSSDEIMEQVIPDLVNKKLKTKLDPAVNEVRDMRDLVNDFNVRLNHLKEEVINLQKLREDIAELRSDKDQLSKEMDEQEDRLSDGVKGLRDDIKKKIESVTEKIYQDLKEIQKKDMDKIDKDIHKTFLSLIQPRFAELEKRDMLIDERMKLSDKRENELYEAIKNIEAPENIKRWLEKRMSSIERGIQTDVNKLKKFHERQMKRNEEIRDNINTIWSETKTLPNRIDNQDIAINKFIEARNMVVQRSESMALEISGLAEKLATNREDMSAIAQRLTIQEARFNELLEGQEQNISKLGYSLKKELKSEVSEIKKEMDKRREIDSRNQLEEFKSETKRVAGLEEELRAGRKVMDKSIEKLNDEIGKMNEKISKNATLYLRVSDVERFSEKLEKRFSDMIQYQKERLDAISDELHSSLEKRIKEITKDIDDRRLLDRQEQISQMKAEFKRLASLEETLEATSTSHESRLDALRNDLTAMQGALADIKFLKERTDELSDISKAFDSRMDASGEKVSDQISRIFSQISMIDKQVKEIRSLYGVLEEKLNLDMKELEKALKQDMAERRQLERDVREQRERVGSIIKELSS
jgi:chromosome segregation ATPase